MKAGELARSLTTANPWWRGEGWEPADADLRAAARRTLDYEPDPLVDIAPGNLYILRGPRRVGKSLELKRVVSRLIHRGVNPRHIVHYPCDRLTAADLSELVTTARTMGGPAPDPRWWLLDEISSITDGWPATIKWLRDNSTFRDDCVVLTGSSSRDLLEAQNELAGRRGNARRSDRYLMPMGFRSFARAIVGSLAQAPDVEVPLAELANRDALLGAVNEVMPWLDDLARAWDLYLQVGGFPAAVSDWLESGEISHSFLDALWDVIHGDAFRGAGLAPAQTQGLLEELSRKLSLPIGDVPLAREVGLLDGAGRPDGGQAEDRLRDLVVAFTVWRCHQRQSDRQLPNLRAFSKTYFSDPLLAHLAHARNPICSDPDPTLLTEQQIGRALSLAREKEEPGTLMDFSQVMYLTTPTRKEIDFVGPGFTVVGVEGKYVDDGLGRSGATLKAQVDAGLIESGILATRGALMTEAASSVWAIPAGIIAWLLPPLHGR